MHTFEVKTTKNQTVNVSCNQNMIDFKRNLATLEQDIPFDNLIIVGNDDEVYSQTDKAEKYQNKTQFKVYDANHLFKQFQAQKHEIYKLNEELIKKNQVINNLEQNIQKLEEEKQQQLKQIQSEHTNVLDEVQKQQEQIIEQQKKDKQNLQIQLQEEKNEAMRVINQLESQNQSQLDEITKLNSKIKNLESEIKNKQTENKELEAQYNTQTQAQQAAAQQAASQYEAILQQYFAEWNQQYQMVCSQNCSLSQAYTEQIEACQIRDQQIEEEKEKMVRLKNDFKAQKRKLETDYEQIILDKDNQIHNLEKELYKITRDLKRAETLLTELQNQQLNTQFNN